MILVCVVCVIKFDFEAFFTVLVLLHFINFYDLLLRSSV
jgi:hypothetical protein